MDYSKEWFKKGQICGEKFTEWRFSQQNQVRDPVKKEEIFQMFKSLRIKVRNGGFEKPDLELFQSELDAIEDKIKDAIRRN
jgi:hypothetical protein